MKEFLEIKNLIITNNLIQFSVDFTDIFIKSDISIYVDNILLPTDKFSLNISESTVSLTIDSNINIFELIHFFINTQTHYSGIIFIYYTLKLTDFKHSLSLLKLSVPSEIESYNYNLSIFTIENKEIPTSVIPLTICNGISANSKISFLSNTPTKKQFEVTLLDNLENPVPDNEYIIEIKIGVN